MKITFVKKIHADGSPCKKCADVIGKMEAANQMQHIDQVLIADERDANSPGLLLAQKHQVERAPFFVVEKEGQEAAIYTVYMKFVKEVLEQKTEESEELKEIMENNDDLDFI